MRLPAASRGGVPGGRTARNISPTVLRSRLAAASALAARPAASRAAAPLRSAASCVCRSNSAALYRCCRRASSSSSCCARWSAALVERAWCSAACAACSAIVEARPCCRSERPVPSCRETTSLSRVRSPTLNWPAIAASAWVRTAAAAASAATVAACSALAASTALAAAMTAGASSTLVRYTSSAVRVTCSGSGFTSAEEASSDSGSLSAMPSPKSTHLRTQGTLAHER